MVFAGRPIMALELNYHNLLGQIIRIAFKNQRAPEIGVPQVIVSWISFVELVETIAK